MSETRAVPDPCPQPALRIGARAVRFAKMLFDNAIRPAALFKIRRGVIVVHGFHSLRCAGGLRNTATVENRSRVPTDASSQMALI